MAGEDGEEAEAGGETEEKVDSGDIIAQKEIMYDWTDTGESLYFKAQAEIVNLFVETYPNIRNNSFIRHQQDLSKGSFHLAKELDRKSNIVLDQKYTGREILNLLRARTFNGHPGCFFHDKNKTYEIKIKIKKKVYEKTQDI